MSAPTLREMDISLSLRMITMGVCAWPMVERFERHTARQGRIADDGHDLLVAARELRACARPSATDSESDA